MTVPPDELDEQAERAFWDEVDRRLCGTAVPEEP